jgi:alpha-1,6-mannosyltransferase
MRPGLPHFFSVRQMAKLASRQWSYIVLLLIYTASLAMIGFLGKRDEFAGIIIGQTLAFGAFGGLLWRALFLKKPVTSAFIALAAVRLCLIWAEPGLSDDYYRYWWDGWLGLHQIDVYAWTPRELLDVYSQSPFATALARNFPLLNSPDYHSVYPALSQFVFRIAVWLSRDDLWLFQCFMKLIYMLGDLSGIAALFYLLPRFGLSRNHALLYYGNPLVIVELFGNLHTEHFMVNFLIVALSCLHLGRHTCYASALALSALAKITVLVWWPLFVRRPLYRILHLYIALAMLATGLTLWLSASGSRAGFLQSLKLYFQTFEFNSALYLHLKTSFHSSKLYGLEQYTGWMLLGVFVICYAILLIRYFQQQPSGSAQFAFLWWSLALYLLLSSTVHPWYLCPLLFPGIFYLSWTSLLWSYLVVWSYSFYDSCMGYWSAWFTAAQFIVAAVAAWIEHRYNRARAIPQSTQV